MPRGPLLLLLLSLAFCSLGRAEETAALTEAARPLEEGVPGSGGGSSARFSRGKISGDERQYATERLGQALVASRGFTEALQVLGAPDVRESPAKRFFQAQAYAGLSRWGEALPLVSDVRIR